VSFRQGLNGNRSAAEGISEAKKADPFLYPGLRKSWQEFCFLFKDGRMLSANGRRINDDRQRRHECLMAAATTVPEEGVNGNRC
jgi:hypothetical protein